ASEHVVNGLGRDVIAADDHGDLSFRLNSVEVEHTPYGQSSGGQVQHALLLRPVQLRYGPARDTVPVLGAPDSVEDVEFAQACGRLLDMARQGKLHQDGVPGSIVIDTLHLVPQIARAYVIVKGVQPRLHTQALTGLHFLAHIALRGPTLAHQNNIEPGN